MRRLFIYPYKMASESAKALAVGLGVKRIKHVNSKFKEGRNKVIINWGSSSIPYDVNVFNRPESVRIASDKLLTFECIAKYNEDWFPVNIPEWTKDKEDARRWIDEGNIVVCRTILNGCSGKGIVLASDVDELVDAPLYVKYVSKKYEYRVHVAFGMVIDQQRKARKKDIAYEDVNWKIRNHSNGFIFMRDGVDLPDVCLDMAVDAVGALGLDFGAVDIIWNEKEDKYYVLEINTACGLTGTTLDKYVEVFNGI